MYVAYCVLSFCCIIRRLASEDEFKALFISFSFSFKKYSANGKYKMFMNACGTK